MKYKKFRDFKITRNCKKKYKTYSRYKENLKEDFKSRCAYCNMPDNIIAPEPFEIDHFIPQNAFENIKPELKYEYDNLMYSCPKCNGNKSDKYKGDINNGKIENEFFYNPVEIDYNEIFYRNEYGGISSEDKKGNEMILTLNLYNPIHNFAWIIDSIEEVEEKIDEEMDKIKDKKSEKYEKLKEADYRLLKYKDNLVKLFKANYYNSKWK